MNPDLPLIGAAALAFGIAPALPRLQGLGRRVRLVRATGVHRAGDPLPKPAYAGFHNKPLTVTEPSEGDAQ